ncbi:hypothetical protein WJX81_002279 [Elliptochloris bilobata]|uniref:Serine aminopeptidase S33 domain-containing protein n=1 Tax=Elliptochloris bilobata TaxID=381761 RepID=A0AAW1RYK2_9CHLO
MTALCWSCLGSFMFLGNVRVQSLAYGRRPSSVLCTSVRPDKTKQAARGTNGVAPKLAAEPGIFSTVDDAGSASIGRYPKSLARPDQYVAQTVLAPGSVPILDLNAETLSGRSANRVALRDIIGEDGGPPRFISPFVPGRVLRAPRAELPLMVYLPGIDGTGLAASRQFPYLVEAFDLRALSVPGHDRTPFPDLVRLIIDYLATEVGAAEPERPVYLLGESFGAVLALAVAAQRPDLVDRLVLVNPATAFQRSIWPRLGSLLPQVPKELYSTIPIALAPVLGNPILLAAFGVDMSAPLPQQAAAFGEGLAALLPQLQALTEILPPPTLAWKLQLLEAGNKQIEDQIKTVQARVLVLTGDGDWLIPSREEGPRLQKLLPRCVLRVMRGRSHALLQEAGINLVALLEEEGFYVRRRIMSAPLARRGRTSFGAAAPIELPTPRELRRFAEGGQDIFRRLVSPVFFSTAADGTVQRGLGAIPDARPMLFVGNHQTYALDIGFLVETLVKERGIMPRGLAHPAIFGAANGNTRDESTQGLGNFMTTFGAVPVGSRNFFRLLQQREAVLLFPGGVREAYKGKGEDYRLFWPDRAEFVRMAARYGATIVPFASVGCEDSVNMILDPQQVRSLPIIGNMLETRARDSIPQARRGVAENKELEDLFIQPFSLPSTPQRFYFQFRAPISTSPADLEDRSSCDTIYRQVKAEVEAGIAYLLEQRKRDPYRDFLPRVAYEASWGGRQAPTFDP